MNRLEYNKLKRSLLKIKEDVRGLLISRYIFKEVQRIIKDNPNIQIGSSFYEWMGYVYSTHAVVGVCRHVDKDQRSLSLIQFLEAVEKHAKYFTLTRFQRLYPKYIRYNLANKTFKRFSGSQMDHLNPATVRSDIRTLKMIVKRISHYRHKRVAHLDKSKFKAFPTYNDLDKALDKLEQLTKKYLLLFLAEDIDLVPIYLNDWKKVFEYPWIKKEIWKEPSGRKT